MHYLSVVKANNNFKQQQMSSTLAKNFKIMISIVRIIQQRILYYSEIKKLKKVNNVNFMTAFDNFTNKFITFNTVKERQILNALYLTNENSNNVVKVDDNNTET